MHCVVTHNFHKKEEVICSTSFQGEKQFQRIVILCNEEGNQAEQKIWPQCDKWEISGLFTSS